LIDIGLKTKTKTSSLSWRRLKTKTLVPRTNHRVSDSAQLTNDNHVFVAASAHALESSDVRPEVLLSTAARRC